jgi:hypothetical protein
MPSFPREQATVGALRAQAKDVDLGFRSSERLRMTGTDTVTVLDLTSKLPTASSSGADDRVRREG